MRRAVAEFIYHYCGELNHQGLGDAFLFLDTTTFITKRPGELVLSSFVFLDTTRMSILTSRLDILDICLVRLNVPKTPPGETRERVYEFVRERLWSGRPPTIREVQHAFHFRAVETARAHLEALVQQGLLVKRNGEARGYALPELESNHLPRLVPILGRVQAGALSTAVEDLEGYVPVEATGSSQELFALRVQGESMTGAGIYPNDLVIVRRQATAHSGEIIVALVEDEATIKRLRIRNGHIELHPENPDFDVIVPTRFQSSILGRVIEIRRFLDKASSPIRD